MTPKLGHRSHNPASGLTHRLHLDELTERVTEAVHKFENHAPERLASMGQRLIETGSIKGSSLAVTAGLIAEGAALVLEAAEIRHTMADLSACAAARREDLHRHEHLPRGRRHANMSDPFVKASR